jgi:hypothetical protein
MEVTVLLLFVSLVLVAGSILLFLTRAKDGDFEHGDRLSLLPLETDATPAPRDEEKESLDD